MGTPFSPMPLISVISCVLKMVNPKSSPTDNGIRVTSALESTKNISGSFTCPRSSTTRATGRRMAPINPLPSALKSTSFSIAIPIPPLEATLPRWGACPDASSSRPPTLSLRDHPTPLPSSLPSRHTSPDNEKDRTSQRNQTPDSCPVFCCVPSYASRIHLLEGKIKTNPLFGGFLWKTRFHL